MRYFHDAEKRTVFAEGGPSVDEQRANPKRSGSKVKAWTVTAWVDSMSATDGPGEFEKRHVYFPTRDNRKRALILFRGLPSKISGTEVDKPTYERLRAEYEAAYEAAPKRP